METNETADWENLPTLPLVKIQCFLDQGTDAVSAGSVCKTWNFAFRDPELWKTIRHTFRDEGSEKAIIKYFRTHARHIRNVFLTFEIGKSRATKRKAVLSVIRCLKIRKLCKARVVCIRFCGSQVYFRNLRIVRQKLTNSTVDFLKRQGSRLQCLELSGLFLPVEEGLRILNQVADSNGNVTDVTVKDFFALVKPHAQFWKEFGDVLTKLRNVTKLVLSLDCVSDEILKIVAEHLTRLKTFNLKFDHWNTIDVETRLTTKCQVHLNAMKKNSPCLVIRFFSEYGVSIPISAKILLLLGVGMTKPIQLTWKNNPKPSFAAFLSSDGEFLDSVVNLSIDCESRYVVDGVLVTVVNRCTSLRHFGFTGTTTDEVVRELKGWASAHPGRTISLDVGEITRKITRSRTAAAKVS